MSDDKRSLTEAIGVDEDRSKFLFEEAVLAFFETGDLAEAVNRCLKVSYSQEEASLIGIIVTRFYCELFDEAGSLQEKGGTPRKLIELVQLYAAVLRQRGASSEEVRDKCVGVLKKVIGTDIIGVILNGSMFKPQEDEMRIDSHEGADRYIW